MIGDVFDIVKRRHNMRQTSLDNQSTKDTVSIENVFLDEALKGRTEANFVDSTIIKTGGTGRLS